MIYTLIIIFLANLIMFGFLKLTSFGNIPYKLIKKQLIWLFIIFNLLLFCGFYITDHLNDPNRLTISLTVLSILFTYLITDIQEIFSIGHDNDIKEIKTYLYAIYDSLGKDKKPPHSAGSIDKDIRKTETFLLFLKKLLQADESNAIKDDIDTALRLLERLKEIDYAERH